jgi:hypothetical protein
MTGNQEIPGQKRRSSHEVQRLVLEFEASGLRQNEFCRKHGLPLSTLQRRLRRRRLDKGGVREGSRLIAVELTGTDRNRNGGVSSALEVVLASGRRIEVRRDFDSEMLLRVVQVLEEI